MQAFSKTGIIRRVIMGLNKHTRAPCGFAFVEYHRPLDAQLAIALLNGSSCDGRVIRVDADSGQDLDGDRKYGRGIQIPHTYIVMRTYIHTSLST